MDRALLVGLALVIALDAGVRISQLVEQIVRHRAMRAFQRRVLESAMRSGEILRANLERIVREGAAAAAATTAGERPN